jgi:hypothetical protein
MVLSELLHLGTQAKVADYSSQSFSSRTLSSGNSCFLTVSNFDDLVVREESEQCPPLTMVQK